MVTRRTRLVLPLLALVGALTFLVPAHAGYWQWGPQALGTGHDDADCNFYRGRADCSGGNYWNTNQYARTMSDLSCCTQYLVGYENASAIRGSYVDQGTVYSNVGGPSVYGFGAYAKAQITYWSGSVRTVLAWAWA